MDFVWTCFMVALGWVFGGIVGGATGIGAIMVAMPLMTAAVTPGEAVLVACLTGLYGTLHLSYSYRKSCCGANEYRCDAHSKGRARRDEDPREYIPSEVVCSQDVRP